MPAHARDLDEYPAALFAQVWHDAAGELDRTGEVGGNHALHVLVVEVLGGAAHAVAGVGDDDVDAVVLGERLAHDALDLGRVSNVESPRPQPVAVLLLEVVELLRPAEGRRDAVAASQDLLGQLASDAA